MSFTSLMNLVDQLQEPRNPIYDFGLGVPAGVLQNWTTPQSMGAWSCPSVACPASPAAQMLAARQHGREISKKSKQNWPVAAVGKDGFQVCMDVAQFKPSELSVKVVDNSIVVEGKHEEREDDHGYISRHFVRRYSLPKGYEAEKVMSSLSSDGVLTVNIPKPKPLEDKSKERIVQIQQVGPAHLNIKQNASEQPQEQNKKEVTNGSIKK